MSTDPKNLVGANLLGRYRLERPIGEGGMGAVFEATQLSLGRKVAVKVMKPAAGNSEDAIKRFEVETEVISRLNHPNIVQVLDAGRADDGTMFLAMELLEGDNVRTVLRREGPMSVDRALAVAEDVASALVAAHERGVIHRDLKTENVMLVRAAGKRESAKVLDFGVAKLTSHTEAPPVTGSGFVVGTPGCIAPEQMLGKSDDPRSDLYSLGVLMFEMLTGVPPFISQNPVELMLKHLHDPPPRVTDVARGRGREVPVPVNELVASLLAKEPQDRPASARDLLDVIRGLADASRATQPDVRAPTPAQMTPTPRGVDIGSKVILSPAASVDVGHPPPVEPAAALVAPPTSPPASPPTSPTTAMPLPPAKAPLPRWKKAAVIAAGLVVVGGVGEGIGLGLAHHSDRLSLNPDAEKELVAAEAAYEVLDVDAMDAHVARAFEKDPDGAPIAFALRATSSFLHDYPLASADLDLGRAAKAAKRRANMMVKQTHAEGLVDALIARDPEEARALFQAHVEHHDCDDPLHFQIFATRAASGVHDPQVVEDIWRSVPADASGGQMTAATALGIARELRAKAGPEDLVEARRLLEQIALPKAPRSTVVIDALTTLDLHEGREREAEERLSRSLADHVDVRNAARLAALQARATGDLGGLDKLRKYLDVLTPGSVTRTDGFAFLGHQYAALGRSADADAMWKEAVASSSTDPDAAGRTQELRAYAQLFHATLRDVARATWWENEIQEHRDDQPSDDPSAERMRAFSLSAKILVDLLSPHPDLDAAKRSLATLSKARQDIPILTGAVTWHLQIAEKDFDAAIRTSEQFPVCWREGHLGAAHLRAAEALLHQGKNDEARAHADAARAALDAGVSEEQRRRCTSASSVLSFLQAAFYVHSVVHRAELAQLEQDTATVTRMKELLVKWWPKPDADEELWIELLRATAGNPVETLTPRALP
jgi:serine/threonine protein kinase/tetratricopeptide (TPR) repeat protein